MMAMANSVCPGCNETVPRKAARCPHCGRALASADAHLTAKAPTPISEAIQPEATTDRAAANAERDRDQPAGSYSSWDEFRLTSPAVQRGMMALVTEALPDLRRIKVLPLPEDAPRELEDWSEPLGTLNIPGDTQVVKILGIAFLSVVGLLMFAFLPGMMCVAAIEGPNPNAGAPGDVVALIPSLFLYPFGGAVCFFCAWWTYRRPPSLSLTLWFFEEGLFLRRGGQSAVARYHEVKAFETSYETGRPLFWITLEDEAPIVLSVGHCPEVIPLMEYIEIRMASAQLLPRLKRIWEGECERFGVVSLDRTHFHGPEFDLRWDKVRRVVDDVKHLLVGLKGRRERLEVRYRDVAFPHLVMAIAHILIDEHQRFPASPS
jgi:hypothetical protein